MGDKSPEGFFSFVKVIILHYILYIYIDTNAKIK